jgi:hypothetical protein
VFVHRTTPTTQPNAPESAESFLDVVLGQGKLGGVLVGVCWDMIRDMALNVMPHHQTEYDDALDIPIKLNTTTHMMIYPALHAHA